MNINCIIIDDDPAYREIISRMIEKVDYLSLKGVFSQALDGYNNIIANKPHLVFLDIRMPDMSGLELLGSLEEKPMIIFVTSYHNHAVDAFNLDALDYLTKPVEMPRFIKAVEKAKRQFKKMTSGDERYFFHINSELKPIELNSIKYLEAYGDYVKIHCSDKMYMIHSTIMNMEQSLPSECFLRIHRSYIIRMDKVEAIHKTSVVIDGTRIPVGITHRNELEKKIRII